MLALILALCLGTPVLPCPGPARSQTQVKKFKKLHPCPGEPDKGSKTKCRGYVVDHICPLACCGLDHPSNMQWQTVIDGKKKDKTELDCNVCKKKRKK
jgi:hypothetical protein